MRKKGHTVGETMARVFEIPVSVTDGLPELTFLGNKEAVVEGCRGVLTYNDKEVRLHAGKLVVKFTGSGLRLNCMKADSVVVTGRFVSVEFLL